MLELNERERALLDYLKLVGNPNETERLVVKLARDSDAAKTPVEERFRNDVENLVTELRFALEVWEDGFKAPEQQVATIFELQKKLWDVQLSWTALCHPRHERLAGDL